MTQLDPLIKASIVNRVLGGDSLGDDCDTFSFEGDDGQKHYQAVAQTKIDTTVRCLFSFPTTGKNIYVTMTDGDQLVVRRVLAALEETETSTGVSLGNVLLLDAPELQAANLVGVILLMPSVSNALNHLPVELSIRDSTFQVCLVVFLTKLEHEVWKAEGHDALMDYFSSHNKDMVAFGYFPAGSGAE